MAEKFTLTPKTKKALVYGGIAAVGVALIGITTLQTERTKPIREPQTISLTGDADTRAVSIEGLNRRLAELESGGRRDADTLRSQVDTLQGQVGTLRKSLQAKDIETQREIDRRVSAAVSAALKGQPMPAAPTPTATAPEAAPRAASVYTPRVQPEQESPDERASRHERERAEIEKRESIYVQPEPPPMAAPSGNAAQSMPAPRIAVYKAKEPEKKDEPKSEIASNIPDIQIPAGSILAAYMLTGLDAPTGTRASQQPVPVLMRIKKEAILPNYAWADVTDCHLLGSAYGDLGSERVNIRGETVSCILRDNTAVEGKVKFYVAGEDGKNGIRGTLVSRSGRILAAAAGSALTQGIFSSLSSTSAESIFMGGGGSSDGALNGASKGFDMLTEYYLDLAEQTFPVIEIKNDRWVDVILTEMLTIKFKG